MNEMTTRDLVAWLHDFAARIEEERQHLTELDASTGDADHGANLSRGMQALVAAPQTGTPGEYLKQAGLVMVDTIGGSAGALYGTIFLRMAATAGMEPATIDGPTMSRALRAAATGITDRGSARPGDKTMLDAMDPAATAFAAAIDAEHDMAAAWAAASAAADAGAAGTAAMRARRGKSSYVGDKSIGAVDPGAASVALMIGSAARVLRER